MERKYFTIEEAEKEIPHVQKLLAKLKRLQYRINTILDAKEILENSIEVTDEDGIEFMVQKEVKINKEFHKLCYAFYKELDTLNEIGCIMKDLNRGLVDFYTKFQGRIVFLCWKVGEEKINHWHEINVGSKGRKKIVDISKKIKIEKTYKRIQQFRE